MQALIGDAAGLLLKNATCEHQTVVYVYYTLRKQRLFAETSIVQTHSQVFVAFVV